MNSEEILKMYAGSKLNELVAEFVFNAQKHQWEILQNTENTAYCSLCRTTANKRVLNTDELVMCLPGSIKKYSTDIAAAWEVVETLSNKFDFAIVNNQNFRQYPNMHYGFRLQAVDENSHIKTIFALGETAPLAICRAALLAVMEAE